MAERFGRHLKLQPPKPIAHLLENVSISGFQRSVDFQRQMIRLSKQIICLIKECAAEARNGSEE
jgi:hypothetical protein